jgi:mannose-6-phosphate isomerase-like protein (cupin superfamily)
LSGVDLAGAAMTSSLHTPARGSRGRTVASIERYKNVPLTNKNGDRCQQIVALRFAPAATLGRQQLTMESPMASTMPSIIDLDAALAALTMCRRTPQSTMADRKGSVARLASYRDGLLLAIKFSGKDHWESHAGDELIHILDGTAVLEMVCDDGPPRSFVLRAGTMAVIPQGAWHRFLSSEGATQIALTPSPGEGEHIELDVDDPRTVQRKPA